MRVLYIIGFELTCKQGGTGFQMQRDVIEQLNRANSILAGGHLNCAATCRRTSCNGVAKSLRGVVFTKARCSKVLYVEFLYSITLLIYIVFIRIDSMSVPSNGRAIVAIACLKIVIVRHRCSRLSCKCK